MIKFLIGFSSGLYVGTYYDIKPQFNYIIKCIKDNIPKEK